MRKLLSTIEKIPWLLSTNSNFYIRRKECLRMLPVGVLMGALLFTSCSSDVDSLETEVSEIEPKDFALVPSPAQKITITGSSEESAEIANSKKASADRGRFDITLNYLTPLNSRQLEVFESAAARWERIIIKDVPSITAEIPSAFEGVPAITETIDDIFIEVVIDSIDGPGKVLGQAGPRFVRTTGGLPISGVMYFDEDDLDLLDELDLFEDVIVHEMGHVLGVGTLWNYEQTLREGPDSNPYFTGKMANVHWRAEGGTEALPIENEFGPGTALSHWRESVLQNELMTGIINLGENPLSRITAGSLKDLGYGAAVVGEQYELERGTPGVVTEKSQEIRGEGIHIAEKEILLEPIGTVSSN